MNKKKEDCQKTHEEAIKVLNEYIQKKIHDGKKKLLMSYYKNLFKNIKKLNNIGKIFLMNMI